MFALRAARAARIDNVLPTYGVRSFVLSGDVPLLLRIPASQRGPKRWYLLLYHVHGDAGGAYDDAADHDRDGLTAWTKPTAEVCHISMPHERRAVAHSSVQR